MCQLTHANALEWRSHCSFQQALKEVTKKKSNVFDCFFIFKLEFSAIVKKITQMNYIFKILKIQKKNPTEYLANLFYQIKHKMGYHMWSAVDCSTNSYEKEDRSLGML